MRRRKFKTLKMLKCLDLFLFFSRGTFELSVFFFCVFLVCLFVSSIMYVGLLCDQGNVLVLVNTT